MIISQEDTVFGNILYHDPLLYKIGQTMCGNRFNNDKFYTFFLNCLFHFSFVILNENESKTNDFIFLRQYLNFNELNDCSFNNLFGIDCGLIKSSKSLKYSNVELIMKQPCFIGLSQMKKENNKRII